MEVYKKLTSSSFFKNVHVCEFNQLLSIIITTIVVSSGGSAKKYWDKDRLDW